MESSRTFTVISGSIGNESTEQPCEHQDWKGLLLLLLKVILINIFLLRGGMTSKLNVSL